MKKLFGLSAFLNLSFILKHDLSEKIISFLSLKNLLIGLITLHSTMSYTQVFTRVLNDEKQEIEHFNTWHIKEEPREFEQPEIDFEKIIAEDKRLGKQIPRFGVKTKTIFTEKDGQFYEYGDWVIWKIAFKAPKAKSLNFTFSNFQLPKSGQMFIYGLNERMIIGPIEPQHIYDRKYASDIINGKKAVIEVLVPKKHQREFTITVDGITQGITRLETRGTGDASACNLDVNCPIGTSLVDNNIYGRFNLSWTGGGTNNTRLSNWLDGNGAPMTTNTVRVPFVNNGGSNFVCTSNRIFTLNNAIPGSNVTWAVTPTSLFATTGGAVTSGVGTSATLRANSNTSSGVATLTYTLTTACNPITVIRQIWVGEPATPTTNPSGTITINMGVDETKTVYLSTADGATSFSANWTASGAVTRIGVGSSSLGKFRGDYEGLGNYMVTTNNVCGNTSNYGQFDVSGNCTICPRIIMTNPVKDFIQLEIPSAKLSIENQKNIDNISGNFFLYDQTGKLHIKEKMKSNKHQTNAARLENGMYLIEVQLNGQKFIEKIFVIK